MVKRGNHDNDHSSISYEIHFSQNLNLYFLPYNIQLSMRSPSSRKLDVPWYYLSWEHLKGQLYLKLFPLVVIDFQISYYFTTSAYNHCSSYHKKHIQFTAPLDEGLGGVGWV